MSFCKLTISIFQFPNRRNITIQCHSRTCCIYVGMWRKMYKFHNKPVPAAIGQEVGYIRDGSTRQSITGQPSTLTLTPVVSLESLIKLRCMCLDGGRQQEYPERTHICTGRTCKLYTERPQPGFKPGARFL